MEIRLEAKSLGAALDAVNRVVPSRPTHPIIGNILLETSADQLRLTATDLSIFLRLEIECEVNAEGSITAPAALLTQIVSKLDGDLTLTVMDERLTIVSDSGSYQIATLPATDFPAMPEVEAEPTELGAALLIEALNTVSYSISSDQTKQVLTGANFNASEGELSVAATDGHRLATWDAEFDGAAFHVIIPGSALKTLKGLLSGIETVALRANDGHAEFSGAGFCLKCRVLDGAYPRYRQLIPAQFSHRRTVNRKAFLAALERVLVMGDGKTHLVQLKFTGAVLEISTRQTDVGHGKETISAEGSGDIEIGFNGAYLVDVFRTLTLAEVKIELNEPNQPVVISPIGAASKQIHLLMPVQIVR